VKSRSRNAPASARSDCTTRATARGACSDAHPARVERQSAAGPTTLSTVSYWPAKLASARSSVVAEERTATAAARPNPPYARAASARTAEGTRRPASRADSRAPGAHPGERCRLAADERRVSRRRIVERDRQRAAASIHICTPYACSMPPCRGDAARRGHGVHRVSPASRAA